MVIYKGIGWDPIHGLVVIGWENLPESWGKCREKPLGTFFRPRLGSSESTGPHACEETEDLALISSMDATNEKS